MVSLCSKIIVVEVLLRCVAAEETQTHRGFNNHSHFFSVADARWCFSSMICPRTEFLTPSALDPVLLYNRALQLMSTPAYGAYTNTVPYRY